jgi:hypothetical protein
MTEPREAPGTGQHARDKADDRTTRHRPAGHPDSAEIGNPAVDPDRHGAVLRFLLQQDKDLGNREEANQCDDRLDPVEQVVVLAGVARNARDRVEPDRGDHQTDQRGEERLSRVDAGHAADGGEGEDIEREVVRRTEIDRPACEDRCKQRQPDDGEGRRR